VSETKRGKQKMQVTVSRERKEDWMGFYVVYGTTSASWGEGKSEGLGKGKAQANVTSWELRRPRRMKPGEATPEVLPGSALVCLSSLSVAASQRPPNP
jgi:hypothetical protein